MEPPPELVEGEPEYEVERILSSRRHGQGCTLQFLVQWKGYLPAHNSWEPQANIHAPELIKEFYEGELMAIKRIVTDDKTTDDPSAIMDFHLNNTASLQYPDSFDLEGPSGINLFILIKDILQVAYNDSPNRSPLPASMLMPKILMTTPGLIYCAAMSEQTEANVNLPITPDPMHPGPPWFCATDVIGHPPFQVTIGEELVTLPFLQYQETHGDVYLLGTKGKGRPAHYQVVHLRPAAGVNISLYNDRDLDIFLQDTIFNTDLAQAMARVNDPHLLAEVACFHLLHAQLPVMISRALFLDKACQALVGLQKERQALDQAFLQKLEGSQRRLVNGRAKLQVSRSGHHVFQSFKFWSF